MRPLLALILLSTHFFTKAEPPILIKNVKVVDVLNEVVISGSQDILIEGDRISRIAASGTIPTSEETIVYEGEGGYVIPGLWDMHAHPDDPEVWRFNPENDQKTLLIPQFVIHGVTGIRDMAGDMNLINEWRRKISEGTLVGPQIVAAGPLLDGPSPMWDGSIGISDVNAVSHIADSLIESGVDFLKVYSLMPREIYIALQKYANEKSYVVSGHIPMNVSNVEASDLGIDALEHMLGIIIEASTKAQDVINGNIDYGDLTDPMDKALLRATTIFNSYDEERARAIFRTFAKNNTWHDPTMNIWYKNAYYETEIVKDSALFQYLPQYLVDYWTTMEMNDHLRGRNEKIAEIKRREYDVFKRIVKGMNEEGVKLLVGTDIGANPLCWPGLGVHSELKLLVEAGLTPAEALQAATINPTTYLGLQEDQGTVDQGKIADLVILKSNPLEDITAVSQIKAVVNKGQLLDEAKRAALLEEIKSQIKR